MPPAVPPLVSPGQGGTCGSGRIHHGRANRRADTETCVRAVGAGGQTRRPRRRVLGPSAEGIAGRRRAWRPKQRCRYLIPLSPYLARHQVLVRSASCVSQAVACSDGCAEAAYSNVRHVASLRRHPSRALSENGMDRPCFRPASEHACAGQQQKERYAMPKSNTAVATIGIDPGKNTLHLVGLDARGGIVLREKVARAGIVSRLSNVAPCLIGIEAGMGTHYVTRELLALGHDVRQVPPVYAKPFRQTHKNDFRDAHAIAEAVQRPTTRCVPPKTDEQLDLQALHRVRYRLVGQRTAIINQIRCFLLEHGLTVRQRLHWLRHALPDILAQRTDVLSPRMVRILEDLAQDWRRLDDRIEAVSGEIDALSKNTEL